MSFVPLEHVLFMLCAAIGVTSNASMDELHSIALIQSAIEVVNTYDNLRDVVTKAELFINSFPCQSSAKPSTSNRFLFISYKIFARKGKVTKLLHSCSAFKMMSKRCCSCVLNDSML